MFTVVLILFLKIWLEKFRKKQPQIIVHISKLVITFSTGHLKTEAFLGENIDIIVVWMKVSSAS